MSPAIWFCGDPHGQFTHIVRAVQLRQPNAIVLLGDIEASQPLERELASILDLTEVWWIHGNHDTDSEASYDNLFGSELADRNLHGRVATVAGVRIAGLGGVFRGGVWAPPLDPTWPSASEYLARCGKGNRWRGGLPLRQRSTIFPDELETLAVASADVLVTHEAPGWHPHGWPALDELAASLGVALHVHGHQHDSLPYSSLMPQSVPYRPVGVGLRGITALDGTVIRPGELDEQRNSRFGGSDADY
ncbi:metallophosphoesterase [Niveibacterium sp.]|uniref:metallophosphoesterase family protein n=1 Tax=Niveibacterium sp. TaxID=2017444 RepID=UPI0035B4B482